MEEVFRMERCACWSVRHTFYVLTVFACMWLTVSAWAIGVPGKQVYVPNEYIVHARAGSSLEAVEESAQRIGATVVKALPLADYYLIRMGRSVSPATGVRLATTAYRPVRWVIDGIQPNYVYHLCAVPNDEYWLKQWDMRLIDMPAAWDLTKGSANVTVAVIDSGVANHPDLSNRLVAGYDFIDNDNDPSNDLIGHGTHVAGTIGAQGGNSIGIAGVCWNGVKIMPVRVFGTEGSTTDIIMQGEDWAFKNGARVFNMSYGGYGDDPVRHQALQVIANAGVILCAAAGNDAVDIPHYPSAYPEVIAVSSVGPYDAPAFYTNYGKIDIAAPGGDSSLGSDALVWSTLVEVDDSGKQTMTYGGMQGTSMACPHVAGAAALLLSYGVPAEEVKNRLLSSARRPKSGSMDPLYYGAGILDVQAALANATLKIAQPKKGSTVGTDPEFKITKQGVNVDTIKIYIDYADFDEDGVPDSGEEPVIELVRDKPRVTITDTSISFRWSDFFEGKMTSGQHNIYVIGTAIAGGADVSDWAVFNVAKTKVPKGIHMFSFPYALTNRSQETPSLILPEAQFGVSAVSRATLIRWIAAPRSATDSTPIGYEIYTPNSSADRVWINPFYSIGGTSLPIGGGYAVYQNPLDPLQPLQKTFTFPAGTGFWLILPVDAWVDDSWADSSRGPLEGLAGFDGSKGFDIRLYAGWNMIGNPYTHAVPWRACLFTYKGQTKSLLDAEAAGWVRSAIYGYGGATVGYQRVSDRDMLEPYKGYWILAQVGGVSSSDSLVLTILP